MVIPKGIKISISAGVGMSLSTLSLPVSPYFKVTDKGIIDVKNQKIVPLVVKE